MRNSANIRKTTKLLFCLLFYLATNVTVCETTWDRCEIGVRIVQVMFSRLPVGHLGLIELNNSTKEKWKFANFKLREKSQNQKFVKK